MFILGNFNFNFFGFYRHCASYFTVNADSIREFEQEPEPEPIRSRSYVYRNKPYSSERLVVGALWKERIHLSDDPFERAKETEDIIQITGISSGYVEFVYKTIEGKQHRGVRRHSHDEDFFRYRYVPVNSRNSSESSTLFEVGDTLIQISDPTSKIEIVDIDGESFSYVHSVVYGVQMKSGHVRTLQKSLIYEMYKK